VNTEGKVFLTAEALSRGGGRGGVGVFPIFSVPKTAPITQPSASPCLCGSNGHSPFRGLSGEHLHDPASIANRVAEFQTLEARLMGSNRDVGCRRQGMMNVAQAAALCVGLAAGTRFARASRSPPGRSLDRRGPCTFALADQASSWTVAAVRWPREWPGALQHRKTVTTGSSARQSPNLTVPPCQSGGIPREGGQTIARKCKKSTATTLYGGLGLL